VQEGRVEALYVSASAGQLPHAVGRVWAAEGKGLKGDRYFSGIGTWSDYPVTSGQDLTLAEAEVLEDVGLAPAEARRNVVTRGIALEALIGKRFRVGAAESYIGPCGPASPSRTPHRGAAEPATELTPSRSNTTNGDATSAISSYVTRPIK
jgi:hypothetical protein